MHATCHIEPEAFCRVHRDKRRITAAPFGNGIQDIFRTVGFISHDQKLRRNRARIGQRHAFKNSGALGRSINVGNRNLPVFRAAEGEGLGFQGRGAPCHPVGQKMFKPYIHKPLLHIGQARMLKGKILPAVFAGRGICLAGGVTRESR